MSKRRDPSIFRRLECFEVTARHGSIARAAEELGVTPSAISHQLADLRRSLGEDLFIRSGRGLVLTNTGQRLAEGLSRAFGILDTSIAEAVGLEHSIISVAVCSSFGPFWLVPRLAEFKELHPNMDIELRLYSEDPELTQASADCIITPQQVSAGYASFDLFEEKVIAAAAPGLVSGGCIDTVPLITTDLVLPELGDDWRSLARAASVALPNDPDWVRCTHYVLSLEAAKAGLGAAILPDFVASSAICEGSLVDLGLGTHCLEDRTYRVCCKEAREREPALAKVVSWIRRVARNGGPADL